MTCSMTASVAGTYDIPSRLDRPHKYSQARPNSVPVITMKQYRSLLITFMTTVRTPAAPKTGIADLRPVPAARGARRR
jgi:hypothetical protein